MNTTQWIRVKLHVSVPWNITLSWLWTIESFIHGTPQLSHYIPSAHAHVCMYKYFIPLRLAHTELNNHSMHVGCIHEHVHQLWVACAELLPSCLLRKYWWQTRYDSNPPTSNLPEISVAYTGFLEGNGKGSTGKVQIFGLIPVTENTHTAFTTVQRHVILFHNRLSSLHMPSKVLRWFKQILMCILIHVYAYVYLWLHTTSMCELQNYLE